MEKKEYQPKTVRADAFRHCLGKGAPRILGGRLSLDDSGDRLAQEILEISANGGIAGQVATPDRRYR